MICTDQLNTQYFLDLAYQMGMCNGENAFITLDFVVPMSDDLDHLGKPVNRNAYEGKITLMLLLLDLLITTACVPDLQPLRVSDLKTHNYTIHITTKPAQGSQHKITSYIPKIRPITTRSLHILELRNISIISIYRVR